MLAASSTSASRPTGRPRIVIADDHRMIVAGLCRLLEPDYDVVGVAHTGDGLLMLLGECPADCLLLDLMMPGGHGLDLIPAIRRSRPELKIVVVTMLLDRKIAQAALAAGASGFVAKDSSIEELQSALSAVLAGKVYVSPRLPKTGHRVGLAAHRAASYYLTPRQEQILMLLGEGRTGTEVAAALGLGVSTITFHKHNLMRVLGFETEASLIQYAVLVRLGNDATETADSN
jgi:DNA-binding NarL/FixJ family response regulator